MARFKIFQDKRGGWVWHLVASNGRIVAQGESYRSRRDARRGVQAVIRAATTAAAVLA